MRTIMVIFLLSLAGRSAAAQDTAYISRNKKTALIFASSVRIMNPQNEKYIVDDKGNGVITIKAVSSGFKPCALNIRDKNSKKLYRIMVVYSNVHAGRRIAYGTSVSNILAKDRKFHPEQIIARQLASGKRTNVVTHEKKGSVKAWINKLSLAGNRIFLRLDLKNRSNLPYGIDFVRFYIRNRKTLDRMATHEQEIVPTYSTMRERAALGKGQELAKVFAFKRFSLSDDEALFIEVYERSGNRHLYLQIRQGNLDDIRIIPAPHQTTQTLAANF